MKYRKRKIYHRWAVAILDKKDKVKITHLFATHDEAETFAQGTGYADADKGE